MVKLSQIFFVMTDDLEGSRIGGLGVIEKEATR